MLPELRRGATENRAGGWNASNGPQPAAPRLRARSPTRTRYTRADPLGALRAPGSGLDREPRTETFRAAAILGLLACLAGGCLVAGDGSRSGNRCIDFEDPPANAVYRVGERFRDSGVTIEVERFRRLDGTPAGGGTGRIDSLGEAGGSGQELRAAGVVFAFALPPLTRLSLRFAEVGGNVNLRINGELRNFANFADVDGAMIAGVHVTVVGGSGNDQGMLSLSGPLERFEIGGQELWLDDICPGLATP